ncbi:MAG: energy-coupling factor transporter transmembrane protein EcfT [Firmicutes bacterium]|nr:energy-coupling factor transporter transmembrane protein EcfT [Bacillota bacterium]
MLSSFIFGQFVAGRSLLHRMDPRTKVAVVLAGVIMTVVAENGWGFALAAAYTALGAALTGLKPLVFVRGLRSFRFILALTFMLQVFLTPGDPLWSPGGLTVTREGLAAGGEVFIRLALLITVTSLLTLTTPPINLTAGLEAIFSPLKRAGLPVHEIAMMMSIALRFVPTLFVEAQGIIEAQRSRGAGAGGINAGIRWLLPLLVPLFAGAIRHAEELAQAMEARCYRPGANRTRLSGLRFEPLDFGALAAAAAALAAAVFLAYY